MSLQTVLAEMDPGWHAAADDGDIPPALLMQARGSALGERLLARWLVTRHASALLAPTPQREIAGTAVRWTRARLQPLLRDLGVLAMAPAIRSEVGREAVRRLKQALGNSYLLALDRSVWDGQVPSAVAAAMSAELDAAMSTDAGAGHEAIYALFDYHGRCELRAWASEHEPALAEWTMLIHPRENALPTVLPADQVQLLHEHHLARNREV